MKSKDIFNLVLLVLVIWLFLRYCGHGNPGGDKTITVDTVYVEVKGDTSYVPKIDTFFTTRTKPYPIEKWDTLYIPEVTEVDTAAILSEFYTTYIYADTLKNHYGYVLVKDTVSRNKIQGRGVVTKLTVPEITRTIILTQPKRTQLFMGAEVLGNKGELFAGYGVNLSLKTRNDQILEAGWNQQFTGQGFFSIGYKRVISFRK